MQVAPGPAAHSPRAGPGATDEAAALRRGRRGTRLAGSDSVAVAPASRARSQGTRRREDEFTNLLGHRRPYRPLEDIDVDGRREDPARPEPARLYHDPFGAPLGYRAHDPAAFVLDFGHR